MSSVVETVGHNVDYVKLGRDQNAMLKELVSAFENVCPKIPTNDKLIEDANKLISECNSALFDENTSIAHVVYTISYRYENEIEFYKIDGSSEFLIDPPHTILTSHQLNVFREHIKAMHLAKKLLLDPAGINAESKDGFYYDLEAILNDRIIVPDSIVVVINNVIYLAG